MTKVLGLDLGTESIGWAFIDTKNETILGTGVRIFRVGVDQLGKADEQSWASKRREARLTRRQNRHRFYRRRDLVRVLKSFQMYPDETDDLAEFMKMDPYFLRYKGLNKQLSLFEFGRVLYHINKRRGFQSNSKSEKQNQKTLEKGRDEIAGFNETREGIKNGGYLTLGEYLYRDANIQRKRSRYTERSMYQQEFEILWERQKIYNEDVYSSERKDILSKIIFSQRKQDSKKYLVNNCLLEEGKKVAPKSSLSFQYFRILKKINDVRITVPGTERVHQPLTNKERELLTELLMMNRELKWTSIRKKLKLPQLSIINLENESKVMMGNVTTYNLLKVFSKKAWLEMSNEKKERIWHLIYSVDSIESIIEYFMSNNISNANLSEIENVHFEDGYCHYSSRALKKIIPFMEKGIQEIEAIEAAGYNIDNIQTKKIENVYRFIKTIRNPTVEVALFELNKLMKAIGQEYGKPERIHIELARDLKKSKKVRKKIHYEIRKREEENKKIRKILEKKFGIINSSGRDLLKYKLWCELKTPVTADNEDNCSGGMSFSPYSNKIIPCSKLFSQEIEIDHILPLHRSLDDSFRNKTICFSNENKEKGNKTPYEWLSHDKNKYGDMITRISRCNLKSKIDLFKQEKLDDDFKHHQLSDTAYISRAAIQLLKKEYDNVDAVKGGVTAQLCHMWGLYSIISPKGIKDRSDHRHHAIDAIAIACCNHKIRNHLSSYYLQRHYKQHKKFEHPWPSYFQDAKKSISNVLVSHKFKRKVGGKLHLETYYGKRRNSEGDVRFVVYEKLIPQNFSKKSDLLALESDYIRNVLEERCRSIGHDIERSDKIPKEVFSEPVMMPDGKTEIKRARISKKTKNMIELYKDSNMYVETRNNHHISIFENNRGKRIGEVVSLFEAAKRKNKGIPVVNKKSQIDKKFIMSLSLNEMIILDANPDDIDFSITNECHSAFSDKLYRVQIISQEKDCARVTFRLHHAATLDNDYEKRRLVVNKIRGTKVIIDSIGRIRPADD